MDEIQNKLFSLKDEKYAEFQAKLTPSVEREFFIGVRNPDVRAYAKEIKNTKQAEDFLNTLPHKYYEENMLHTMLLNEEKDFAQCIERVERFLPYIDNWAVCDCLSPKAFKRNKTPLEQKAYEWCQSEHTYVCRFGIKTFMSHFLDNDFKPEQMKFISKIESDEYYINMMISWYFATALAKQWSDAIKYFEKPYMQKFCHNKSLQKAIESYRITPEQKKYLRTLKI